MFPLSAMGIIAAVLERARTAVKRVQEIATAPCENEPRADVSEKIPTTVSKAPSPLLEIKKLSYSYDVVGADGKRHNNPVLHEISFALQSGEHLGLFGRVGSGKSTLFDLITRLQDPPKGTIFLNGTDVLDLPIAEVRGSIGYCLQSVHLFSESITENVAFGLKPIPDDQTIHSVARAASIADEIEAMEKKWDSQIGEKGVRLSGGQKQRLALARAFIRQPKMLILDDVFSAVDQATEQRLLNYIYERNISMIMVSHRLPALRRCNRILMIENGAIADQGTVEELMNKHPKLFEEITAIHAAPAKAEIAANFWGAK